jgi:hypothetical protein
MNDEQIQQLLKDMQNKELLKEVWLIRTAIYFMLGVSIFFAWP